MRRHAKQGDFNAADLEAHRALVGTERLGQVAPLASWYTFEQPGRLSAAPTLLRAVLLRAV